MYPLLKYSFGKRMKDSFLISYGIMFPIIMILLLGYLSKEYYTGIEGVNSYFYYTVVTIPYCTLLSSITLVYVAREESRAGCGSRFIIAPISNNAIVISKIFPSAIVIGIYNVMLLIICKLIFNVDFSGYYLKIIFLLLILGFMSAALGTYIGLCSKNFMIVKNFISTPIMILAFLGGGFFPVGNIGIISPLFWINRGLFLLMKDGVSEIYYISLILTLVVGIVFTILAIKKMRKEAFLDHEDSVY